MLRVNIDRKPGLLNIGQVQLMGDLVELIKATIDPDKIIVDMQVDGRPLSDDDWRRSLASLGNSLLEVSTGDKGAYVLGRLAQAPALLKQIAESIGQARSRFQAGDSTDGNQKFKIAVQNLNAYMNWYMTILAVDGGADNRYVEQVTTHIEEITKICERVVKFMLYNSWWAVGEALEKDLEPRISLFYGDTESFCEKASKYGNLNFPFA